MKYQGKKMLSILLAAELAAGALLGTSPAPAAAAAVAVQAGTPYSANGSYNAAVPHIIVNQVYGAGLEAATDAQFSNGFIELYNPTEHDVDLSGWSLQYADRGTDEQTGPTGDWVKLDLTGTIKARSSYLITGAATEATAPKLELAEKADQTWPDRYMNNKGLKVALMSNQNVLTVVNPYETKPESYVDMLGTGSNDDGSDIDGYETAYPSGDAEGTSKKKALRRGDETVDTDNNKLDFEQVDYSKASAETIAEMKPRSGEDGAWGDVMEQAPLKLEATVLEDAYAGKDYSVSVNASGGTPPYTYAAEGLPAGLVLDAATGAISGKAEEAGSYAVQVSVTDSSDPAASVSSELNLTVREPEQPEEPQFSDAFGVLKIGEYKVGVTNEDGGVAEIVKYNKDNGKFYLVNGSSEPPSLDIVALNGGKGTLQKEKTVFVQELAETDGFVYGDLTSVDVNTETKRVAVSVQEADPAKNGKILVLDYDGNLLGSYTAGVQPDMIKSTPDGRYILTADEAEPRTAGQDAKGSVTIVDTQSGDSAQVLFDDPSVIDDNVYIRGESDPETGMITGRGTKEDAVFDLEPEYIALSGDGSKAYVTLQENNAVAEIDIAGRKVESVKGLGFKDLNDPKNALDLLEDDAYHPENVPFYGVYMPDGIASYSVGDATYLVTANEGDATEWDGRVNASTIGDMKGELEQNSEASGFLNGTDKYDDVEAISGIGHDSLYLYGGRSFTIWEAGSMSRVFDSGNDFEAITAERLPENFNASNSKTAMDDRSPKKGPEPEDVKVGKVGTRTLAFVGLERIGGIMTYDVTDPAAPSFANYTNTRVFTPKNNLDTDTAPEGIEFIPAAISPTGQPLLLVAYEVGGRVAVFQLNTTRLTLDKTALSLRERGASAQLVATVTPAGGGSQTVGWTSSNPQVATVDASGRVTPHNDGTAVVTAVSEDGYGLAEAAVTVSERSNGGGPRDDEDTVDETPEEPADPSDSVQIDKGDSVRVTASIEPEISGTGQSVATITAALAQEFVKAAEEAGVQGQRLSLILKAEGSQAEQTSFRFEREAFAALNGIGADKLALQAGKIEIALDKLALQATTAAAAGGDVTVAVRKTAGTGTQPAYEIGVTAGGSPLASFGQGKAHIRLPYELQAGEDAQAVIVSRLNGDDGESSVIPASSYDASAGRVSFTANALSGFAIGYDKQTFNDTNGSFASDAITYLAARGLIGGVGAGDYKPKANMTRADFTLVLARMAGADLGGTASVSFRDVKSTDYYAAAVAWATQQGIASGVTDTAFDPHASITREQMAAMIVRYAEAAGFALPEAADAPAFADAAAISSFAAEAASAVQRAGIVNGKPAADGGSNFAPKDFATREETAKMLAKLLQLMAE